MLFLSEVLGRTISSKVGRLTLSFEPVLENDRGLTLAAVRSRLEVLQSQIVPIAVHT
jgi:hypothetical protein